MRRVAAFTPLLAIAVLLGACSTKESVSSTDSESPATTTPETTGTTAVGPAESVESPASPPVSESESVPTEPDGSPTSTTGVIQGFAFACTSPGACAASTSVAIQPADGSTPRTLVTTDATGRFTYTVNPGDWQVAGRFTLGMVCDRDAVTVTVVAGATVDVGTFNCAPA